MQSTRSSASNAEREFLDSIRGAAAPTPIDRARQVQRPIDASSSLRIPFADAIEIRFEQLTRAERNAFFGSVFADTVPAGLS